MKKEMMVYQLKYDFSYEEVISLTIPLVDCHSSLPKQSILHPIDSVVCQVVDTLLRYNKKSLLLIEGKCSHLMQTYII